jgi:hypothetical protein
MDSQTNRVGEKCGLSIFHTVYMIYTPSLYCKLPQGRSQFVSSRAGYILTISPYHSHNAAIGNGEPSE